MARVCIGIDFGGTYLKFGLVDEAGNLLDHLQLETPAAKGREAILDRMVRGVDQLLRRDGMRRQEVVGIGVGSPGPLSISEGIIHRLPNVPGMENLALPAELTKRLDLPACMENDANAAAYGEFLVGAGRETRDMVMLTLGTGVGSGIILDGRIVHGAHEVGGEIGHMIVEPGGRECSCGQRGCLEQYCSASNLARNAAERLEGDPKPGPLLDRYRERGGRLEARDVHDARQAGDEAAEELWQACARYLAIGCINVCRIFDPDSIVLAGGMAKAGDSLIEPVRAHYRNLNWNMTEPKTTLVIASLGSRAGVIGAGGVAWQELGDRSAE
jgi:glucokinase